MKFLVVQLKNLDVHETDVLDLKSKFQLDTSVNTNIQAKRYIQLSIITVTSLSDLKTTNAEHVFSLKSRTKDK